MTSRTHAADDTDAIARRLAELRGQSEPRRQPVEHFPEDDWAILKASVRVDRDRPRVIPARVLP